MRRGGFKSGSRTRLAALAVLCLAVIPAPASARDYLDIDVFARVPSPGLPEGIAVGSDRTVHVGTSPKDVLGLDGRPPSKLFSFDPSGQLTAEQTIAGQDRVLQMYGLYGLAVDAENRIYAADNVPPRILRLDPDTGEQTTYATFRDVPTCTSAARTTDCSATFLDMRPFPNSPVFAADGTMYVTDNAQALIWRVPPGGGDAEVWFTDPGFETVFGPNGISFEADGRTLLFALTLQGNPLANPPRPAGLYRLPVEANGSPGPLSLFWQAGLMDAPDGFTIAASGNVYVALSGPTVNALAALSPQGAETHRVPSSPQANQQLEIPFDQPANVAFLDDRLLVTNHAFTTRNPQHYAVLDVFAGEGGLPLNRPNFSPGQITGQQPFNIRIRGVPRRRCADRNFRVLVSVTGGDHVSRVTLRVDNRWIKRTARGRFRATIDVDRLSAGRHRVTAKARGSGSAHARQSIAFRRC